MAESAKTIEISILGRNYKIACEEGEREALMEAVTYLDGKMGEIKKAGKVSGTDRIAVMAALNITNELLRERRAPPPAAKDPGESTDGAPVQRRIHAMQAAIDQALAGQEKLF